MSTSFLGGDNLSFISGGGGGGGNNPITIIKTCSIPTGVTIVDSTTKLGNNSVFYNYTLYDCSNFVSGTIVVVWRNRTNQISYYETATVPIGNTNGATIGFEIVGNSVNMVLTTNNSSWKINLSKIVFQDCCSIPYVSEAKITTESGLDLITENNDYLITE